MSSRFLLWLWAGGIALATLTIAVILWQAGLLTESAALFLAIAGLWLCFGAAVAIARRNYNLALKFTALALIPALSALFVAGYVTGYGLSTSEDVLNNRPAMYALGLLVTMLIVFLWQLMSEEKWREANQARKPAPRHPVRTANR